MMMNDGIYKALLYWDTTNSDITGQNVELRTTQQLASLAGEHLAVGIDGDTTGHTSLGAECEPDPGAVSERWLGRYFGG